MNFYGGAGNDVRYGTAWNDQLCTGIAGHDLLVGNGGNDFIDGGAGDDTLEGGDGNDAIFGGAGENIIGGGKGNDQITGGANVDMVAGGDGNDTIAGGLGLDWLDGGAGDDVINGGFHSDRLTGGSGADTFLFLAGDVDLGSAGRYVGDWIEDFESGIDIVDLRALASLVPGGFLFFDDNDGVSHEAGEIMRDSFPQNGNSEMSVDLNGDGALDLKITFYQASNATSDFLLA